MKKVQHVIAGLFPAPLSNAFGIPRQKCSVERKSVAAGFRGQLASTCKRLPSFKLLPNGLTRKLHLFGRVQNLLALIGFESIGKPERFPRRIIRLLHQVRRIELDVCPSEASL